METDDGYNEESAERRVIVTPLVKERAKALLRTIRLARSLLVTSEVLKTRAGAAVIHQLKEIKSSHWAPGALRSSCVLALFV